MERYAVSFSKLEIPKFILGCLSITPNAQTALSHEEILASLKRHMLGDWGDLEANDIAENDAAFVSGGRLFSAYTSSSGKRYWIITEDNRQYTTILLPEDY